MALAAAQAAARITSRSSGSSVVRVVPTVVGGLKAESCIFVLSANYPPLLSARPERRWGVVVSPLGFMLAHHQTENSRFWTKLHYAPDFHICLKISFVCSMITFSFSQS